MAREREAAGQQTQHSKTMLDGMRVAILITEGFEQIEMTEPRRTLDEAGAMTCIVAPKAGSLYAMHHHDKADPFRVDATFEQARPDDFDGVLLPGGALNADALRVVREARDFVRRIDELGKPIAVICHAPWLLVSAGLVTGRALTSYHTLQDDIRNAGGRWRDMEFVRDWNWVSSRGPDDLPAFCMEMTSLFAEHRAAGKQEHAA
jgi:protease I